jgi:hypothetical protein
MDPNGIHHKNVVVHFLSAQNFVMDFPIHFQREIHRKKKSISIHKMPAILSQEICDGFADTFARSIAKMSKKRWLVVFSQQKKCDEFSNTCPKKKTIAKFPEVDHKNVPEEFCDGSQWDPSQKCGLVISSSKEFCDGLSNACPRKNPPHFFKNPFAKCLPPSAKNFVMDPNGIHHKNLALSLDFYGFQTLATVPSKKRSKKQYFVMDPVGIHHKIRG